MNTFRVVFWFVDHWDASHDRMEEFSCSAMSEEDALSQFYDEHGFHHSVQCVLKD